MEKTVFDVAVIGGGAAGLMAALELALTGRSVAVVEAKDRCGGRMHTVLADDGYPVELGAEFVHGKLPITLGLLKKAGLETVAVNGSFWQHKEGRLSEQEDMIEDDGLEKAFDSLEHDMSVQAFLDTRLAGLQYEKLRLGLRNYVEGYYAADPTNASTFSLRDELRKGEEEQYRIRGGYAPLVSYLQNECLHKGVRFFFGETVTDVVRTNGCVEIVTVTSAFRAARAVVAVSLGVLQHGVIRFSPALPEKLAAAGKLGFGHIVKINFVFETAFWKDKALTQGQSLDDAAFVFSEQPIPTWWTQHPSGEPLLVAWLGGPRAKQVLADEADGLAQKALQSLGAIFNLDVVHLSQLVRSTHFHNWTADPTVCGAYAYEVVDGERHKQILLAPVSSTLYFAGEGLYSGTHFGTVEAALTTGRDAAHRLIADAARG